MEVWGRETSFTADDVWLWGWVVGGVWYNGIDTWGFVFSMKGGRNGVLRRRGTAFNA